NETGQIENPEKVQSKGDDVMALIAQLSAKIGSDLKLNACGAARSASAAPAQQGGTVPVAKDGPARAAAVPSSPATETFAKALTEQERKQVENVHVDARTMLLYS